MSTWELLNEKKEELGPSLRRILAGPAEPEQPSRERRRAVRSFGQRGHQRRVAAAVPGDDQPVPLRGLHERGPVHGILLAQLLSSVFQLVRPAVAVQLHVQRKPVRGQRRRRDLAGVQRGHGQVRGAARAPQLRGPLIHPGRSSGSRPRARGRAPPAPLGRSSRTQACPPPTCPRGRRAGRPGRPTPPRTARSIHRGLRDPGSPGGRRRNARSGPGSPWLGQAQRGQRHPMNRRVDQLPELINHLPGRRHPRGSRRPGADQPHEPRAADDMQAGQLIQREVRHRRRGHALKHIWGCGRSIPFCLARR